MSYGIIFWVTVIMLSMLQGMKTWTWFDETCLRVYTRVWCFAWYEQYQEEKRKKMKGR